VCHLSTDSYGFWGDALWRRYLGKNNFFSRGDLT